MVGCMATTPFGVHHEIYPRVCMQGTKQAARALLPGRRWESKKITGSGFFFMNPDKKNRFFFKYFFLIPKLISFFAKWTLRIEVVNGKKFSNRISPNHFKTILKRAWSANFKMVCYVLLRPLRPELDGQYSA
jgi:hypothetical protein